MDIEDCEERSDKLNKETSSLKMDFPSNSHKSHTQPEKKRGKIIKGGLIKRKKSLGKKLAETFLGENLSNVISYITYDVLIPAAKSTLDDMVSGGIHKLLFRGDEPYRSRRDGRDRGRPYVSYDAFSRSDRDDRRPSQNRARHNMEDIILATRSDAEEVLDFMQERLEEYGLVTVAYFYELVGIKDDYPDQKYGWENLNRAMVQPVRGGGYLIDLPKPILID